MNKVLTAMVVLFAGFSSFAQQVSVASMRQELRSQIKLASSIAKDCGQVKTNVAQNQLQMKQLAHQINGLGDEQHPRIQDALSELTKAYKILDQAESDCRNGLNYSALLLEMYLEHVDTALMEYRYGIGQDLKRLRY